MPSAQLIRGKIKDTLCTYLEGNMGTYEVDIVGDPIAFADGWIVRFIATDATPRMEDMFCVAFVKQVESKSSFTVEWWNIAASVPAPKF